MHPLQKQQQHQATGFTGRLFFFVLTSLVLVRGRTLMLHTLGEQRGGVASAGYGRTGGKSSSRCKCSWPRRNTTPPHGDRARPGARGGNEQYYTATFRSNPLPRRQALSTFPWTSKMCLPPGRGLTASLASGRRSGFSSTQWTRSSTPRLRCRFLMSLCC